MSVNTKMFVTAGQEKFLDIMPKVVEQLNKWQREKLHSYCKENGFNNIFSYLWRDKKKDQENGIFEYSNGVNKIHSFDFRNFEIFFTIRGEHRRIFVTPNCSMDYGEVYEGDKIIFDLNAWGMSEEIMMSFADVLKEFGDVYYTPNDCSEDFVKLA